jgi:hypothetical protein
MSTKIPVWVPAMFNKGNQPRITTMTTECRKFMCSLQKADGQWLGKLQGNLALDTMSRRK